MPLDRGGGGGHEFVPKLFCLDWSSNSSFNCVIWLQVDEGDDKLWDPEVREPGPEIKARGLKFTQWLMSRPEQRIAVVSHSSFLFFLSSNFGENCGESALVSHQASDLLISERHAGGPTQMASTTFLRPEQT